MMTLVNTHSEGLTILPTHRVAAHLHDFTWSGVRRHLEPWFAAEASPFSSEENKAEARREFLGKLRSEERRVGKECRSRWWPGLKEQNASRLRRRIATNVASTT